MLRDLIGPPPPFGRLLPLRRGRQVNCWRQCPIMPGENSVPRVWPRGAPLTGSHRLKAFGRAPQGRGCASAYRAFEPEMSDLVRRKSPVPGASPGVSAPGQSCSLLLPSATFSRCFAREKASEYGRIEASWRKIVAERRLSCSNVRLRPLQMTANQTLCIHQASTTPGSS